MGGPFLTERLTIILRLIWYELDGDNLHIMATGCDPDSLFASSSPLRLGADLLKNSFSSVYFKSSRMLRWGLAFISYEQ